MPAKKVFTKLEGGSLLIEKVKVPAQGSLNDLGLGRFFHLCHIAEPVFEIFG
jgi:hypothetical protein